MYIKGIENSKKHFLKMFQHIFLSHNCKICMSIHPQGIITSPHLLAPCLLDI